MAVLRPGKLLLLFKLLLDFPHFFAHAVVGTHRKSLPYQLDTKT
jgi:hypothetical protein